MENFSRVSVSFNKLSEAESTLDCKNDKGAFVVTLSQFGMKISHHFDCFYFQLRILCLNLNQTATSGR